MTMQPVNALCCAPNLKIMSSDVVVVLNYATNFENGIYDEIGHHAAKYYINPCCSSQKPDSTRLLHNLKSKPILAVIAR